MDGHQTAKEQETVEAAVGYVRVISGSGPTLARGWVDCPRNASAIPVETCPKCEHCVSVSFAETGRVDSLRCVQPWMDQRSRTGHSELRADIPKVADLMTRDVLCVRPDLSLESLMTLFAEYGYKAMPVLGEGDKLVGMVSESDVVAYLQARSDTLESVSAESASRGDGMHEAFPTPEVEDVMNLMVLAIPEYAPLPQAAALMAFDAIHRVVVLNGQGHLVGLLSASDVLRWLGRAAGYGPAAS